MGLFGRRGRESQKTAAGARKFDLNIEEVLDGWEVRHAIREIIANAIDEQILTGTADMEIRQTGKKSFTILDRGRGIRPEHLTQNENAEKLSGKAPVIGRFGVGLKDALAVLSRRDVNVRISSRHCTLTTSLVGKHGFEDITTLHALVGPPGDDNMVGTEVMLENVEPVEVEGAKSLFRRFNGEDTLESTKYGDVIRKDGGPGRIYTNGVLVATEDNFLFSYDITKPTKKMRQMLNRERVNVGRQAYTERVKSILMDAKSAGVVRLLAGDVGGHETGMQHDETNWLDVSVRACKLLNAADENVVFATAGEQRKMASTIDDARREGRNVITIPDSVGDKLASAMDEDGGAVRDMRRYVEDLNERFEFQYVRPEDLTPTERRVWDITESILRLVGAPHLVGSLRISETMRPGRIDANGLCEGERITIKRSALSSMEGYAGVLLHEAAHATSGEGDVTREFESKLTWMLGRVAVLALERG